MKTETAKHTAGDWVTGVPSPMGIAVQTIMKSPSGEFPVCVPLAWCQTKHAVAATQFYYVAVEEAVANARLMAAAPLLLAELQSLIAMCERQADFNDDGDGRQLERAHAAIRKATTQPS